MYYICSYHHMNIKVVALNSILIYIVVAIKTF